MLIGQFTSKLTGNNRISVPVKFREELGENLIVARWYENCLVLVSVSAWENLLKRLIGESKLIVSSVRDIDRFIYGSAFEIKLDFQGRFIIPEVLKKYSGIFDEATFVGLGDRVEIWSSQSWLLKEENSEKRAALAIEKIAGGNK